MYFPSVFLSKIICVVTSHFTSVIVNTTFPFPVMDEVTWGFRSCLNLYIRIVRPVN